MVEIKNNIILSLFLLLYFDILICNKYPTQPPWNLNLNFDEIEKDLSEGNIKSMKCFFKCDKSKPVYLVILDNGLKAIFKSRGSLSNLAEVVAYKISVDSKQYLVPPTVIRVIDSKEGSLQFFVDTKITSKEQEELFMLLSPKCISDINLFNFCFGKYDWSTRWNIIINRDNNGQLNLASIDHGCINNITKCLYGDYPWIRYYKVNKKEYNTIIFNENNFFYLTQVSKKIIDDFKILKDLMKLPYINKIKGLIAENCLYIQFLNYKLSFSNIYFRSTLNFYHNLNLDSLYILWFRDDLNLYNNNKDHFDELFKDILNRKDSMLKHAFTKGIIIEDV